MLLSLAAYVVLWTVYGTIAKSSQGLHPDMTELIAWSRDLAWGYKHPPLAALIVRLWFSVFPVAEWSYYLLAMLMPAIALWIAWRLSADYLDIEKRVVGLALLMLIPFFNFHALKFNVNTVLMPLWAATTFWFLRSYRTRSALYAALAGIGAAACMLGKYWSVFLLAGLAHRGADRQTPRRLFPLRRALDHHRCRPRRAGAASALALPARFRAVRLCHVHTRRQVVRRHRGRRARLSRRLGRLCGDPGDHRAGWRRGQAARTIADMIWPADSERRLAAAAFWAPLLLPAVGALASGTETHLAVVDVGLDAAAGAAAVAAGGHR